MIKVEIRSTVTTTREGISKKSGQPYKLIEQRGWLHGAKDYPTEVSFLLENGQLPFAPGYYVAGSECVQVDNFGACRLNFSRMKPIDKAAGLQKAG